MWQYRADTPRASGVKSLFLPTLARLRSLFSPYCCCGDNCASPCASAGRAASDPARSSTTRKRARYVRLVAPVRTYSAPPVAGSFIATAAASLSCRTYAHTHRTKPNLGRACASLAGAKPDERTCASLAGAEPDAYGSCTARRAERGSAERLIDRLAIDRARRRAGLIKLCTYRHLECVRVARGCTDASASFRGRWWGILRGELSRARTPGTAWGKAPCSEPCAGCSDGPDSPGSSVYRAHHGRACTRRCAAACGHEPFARDGLRALFGYPWRKRRALGVVLLRFSTRLAN